MFQWQFNCLKQRAFLRTICNFFSGGSIAAYSVLSILHTVIQRIISFAKIIRQSCLLQRTTEPVKVKLWTEKVSEKYFTRFEQKTQYRINTTHLTMTYCRHWMVTCFVSFYNNTNSSQNSMKIMTFEWIKFSSVSTPCYMWCCALQRKTYLRYHNKGVRMLHALTCSPVYRPIGNPWISWQSSKLAP